MSVLIDSSVVCAYANTKDVNHLRAKKIIDEIVADRYGKPLITDHIFDEIVSVILRKKGKTLAVELGTYLLNSEFLLAKINETIFTNAWDTFQEKNSFSFTDCTTLEFMKIFEIDHLATFDKEFKSIKGINVLD